MQDQCIVCFGFGDDFLSLDGGKVAGRSLRISRPSSRKMQAFQYFRFRVDAS